VKELGLEPGPALQRLQQAILRQDPVARQSVADARSASTPASRRRTRIAFRRAGRALPSRWRAVPSREVIIAMARRRAVATSPRATRCRRSIERPSSLAVSPRARSPSAPRHQATISSASRPNRTWTCCSWTVPRSRRSGARWILTLAPCDVAVYVGRGEPLRDGPVLVLFTGGDHDWSAVELGAWLAAGQGAGLRLAGPAEGAERDASRALASASLAVQRVLGIAAEPMLLAPDATRRPRGGRRRRSRRRRPTGAMAAGRPRPCSERARRRGGSSCAPRPSWPAARRPGAEAEPDALHLDPRPGALAGKSSTSYP
jgi:hypothetical protein